MLWRPRELLFPIRYSLVRRELEDGNGLENRSGRKATVGSNPILSAILSLHSTTLGLAAAQNYFFSTSAILPDGVVRDVTCWYQRDLTAADCLNYQQILRGLARSRRVRRSWMIGAAWPAVVRLFSIWLISRLRIVMQALKEKLLSACDALTPRPARGAFQ